MLCQHCNKNEANYKFVVDFGTGGATIHLCAECTELLREQFADFYKHWQLIMSYEQKTKPQETTKLTRVERRQLGLDPFPTDAGSRFRHKRELAELQAQLQNAISREDYESAAMLRDKIAASDTPVAG